MPGLLVLDGNVAALSLPAVRHAFALGPSQAQWLISAYGLCLGGFLLLGGRLADACDRRSTLCGGLAAVAVGSLAVSLASSFPGLIAARILEALGAALAFPAALASLTGELSADGRRFRVAGVFATASSAGFFAATVLGGAVMQAAGWRAGFLIAPALAAVAVAVLWRSWPPTGRRTGGSLPARSAVLEIPMIVAAGSAIVLGLTLAAQSERTRSGVAWLVLGGALIAGLGLLVRLDRTTVLPRHVLALRSLQRAAGAAWAAVASGVGTMVLLSLYLQDQDRVSASRAGLVLAVVGLGGVLAGVLMGRAAAPRTGAGTLTGTILVQVAGIVLLATAVAAGSMPVVLAGAGAFGLGHFATMAQLADRATFGLATQHYGVAGGILQTAQQFGSAAGVALVSGPASCRNGCAGGFLVAAALALAATLGSVGWRPGRSTRSMPSRSHARARRTPARPRRPRRHTR